MPEPSFQTKTPKGTLFNIQPEKFPKLHGLCARLNHADLKEKVMNHHGKTEVEKAISRGVRAVFNKPDFSLGIENAQWRQIELEYAKAITKNALTRLKYLVIYIRKSDIKFQLQPKQLVA